MTGDGKAEAGRRNESAGVVKNIKEMSLRDMELGSRWECMCRIEGRCSISLVQSKE